MAGRSCWCIEEFRDGELEARNIDVMECSRLVPAFKARRPRDARPALPRQHAALFRDSAARHHEPGRRAWRG